VDELSSKILSSDVDKIPGFSMFSRTHSILKDKMVDKNLIS